MYASPIEYLAQRYDNVVRYDADGNPSVFVRFPKVMMSELDDRLPNKPHPAFIGPDGETLSALLIAKYKCCRQDGNPFGVQYSLPGLPPTARFRSFNHAFWAASLFPNACPLSVYDYGFLILLANKHGWEPEGNVYYGHSSTARLHWETSASGKTYQQGFECAYKGWTYTCIQAHVSTADSPKEPGSSPAFWQRGERTGGTVTGDDFRTINGSGPLEWYLGGDASGLCDIVGNGSEAQFGFGLSSAPGEEGKILLNSPVEMWEPLGGTRRSFAYSRNIRAANEAYGEADDLTKPLYLNSRLYYDVSHIKRVDMRFLTVRQTDSQKSCSGYFININEMSGTRIGTTGTYVPAELYAAGIAALPRETGYSKMITNGHVFWTLPAGKGTRNWKGNAATEPWIPADPCNVMYCAGGGSGIWPKTENTEAGRGTNYYGQGHKFFRHLDEGGDGITVRMKIAEG